MIKMYNGTTWDTVTYSRIFNGTEQFTYFPVAVRTFPNAITAWTIKGNTQASGTQSPQHPVTITGLGNETANLFDEETLEGYYTSSGSYNYVTGQLCTKNKIAVNPNTEYWLGIPATNPLAFLAVSTYDSQGAFIERFVLPPYTGAGVQYTTNANTYFINVNFSTYYGGSYKNDVMICEGAQRSYQPYNKYEISIYNNGTSLSPMYLNCQLMKVDNTVDILNSNSTVTRNIGKIVFKGTEDWSTEGTDNFYTTNEIVNAMAKTLVLCTHQQSVSTTYLAGSENVWISSSGKLNFTTSAISHDLTTFKQWLADQYSAGTPVTVWYILATPTTESVTVPVISTSSVTTIDIIGQVKPSEMSLTYEGIHIKSRKKCHISENLFNTPFENGTLNEGVAAGSTYAQCYSPNQSLYDYRLRTTQLVYLNEQCTISVDFSKYELFMLYFDENQLYTGNYTSSWVTSAITINVPYVGIIIKKVDDSAITPNETDINVMINKGSSALPYEEYGVHWI